MSFEDLPADWPARSLTDLRLAADVVDLMVSCADRASGTLTLLLCDDRGRLVQPVAVDLEGQDRSAAAADLMAHLEHLFTSGLGSSLLLAIARPGFSSVTDGDRAWHQAAIDLCRRLEVPLLGTYVVTLDAVVRLPEPLDRPEALASA